MAHLTCGELGRGKGRGRTPPGLTCTQLLPRLEKDASPSLMVVAATAMTLGAL